jgi:hypothetical protein
MRTVKKEPDNYLFGCLWRHGLICVQKNNYQGDNMNIFMYFVIAVGVLLGAGSTVAIVLSFFITLGNKFIRKIKYGISLFD